MVSLLSFWFQSRRHIFTLVILAAIGLSAFMAVLTSGSRTVMVISDSGRVVKQDDSSDNELEQWLFNRPFSKVLLKPKTTQGVKMASTNSDKFDAVNVLALFTSCRNTDNVLSIDCYVNAYEELCKLFNLFGTVFGFVSSDVVEKIGILRDYRKSADAEHYATIQGMLEYEVKQGTTASKKKASGARTLLRLHRALEFISALLVKIRQAETGQKFSAQASTAYDDTLAKHHPWLIKKAVHMAMYMLPSRQDLLKKMNVADNEEGMKSLSDLIKELTIIYDVTEKLYSKDKLLDLP